MSRIHDDEVTVAQPYSGPRRSATKTQVVPGSDRPAPQQGVQRVTGKIVLIAARLWEESVKLTQPVSTRPEVWPGAGKPTI